MEVKVEGAREERARPSDGEDTDVCLVEEGG